MTASSKTLCFSFNYLHWTHLWCNLKVVWGEEYTFHNWQKPLKQNTLCPLQPQNADNAAYKITSKLYTDQKRQQLCQYRLAVSCQILCIRVDVRPIV